MSRVKPKSFRFEVEDGVGHITLTRPDRLNSLTFQVYEELADTFAALDGEPDVRSIVIAGEGRAFCSGGDVADIIAELFSRDMHGLVEFTRLTGRLIANIRKVRRPVVAAIQGVAVGAGAVVALACDFRVVGDKGRFGFIFPRVGLCGADMGAAYLLPRVVGLGHASRLLFTGDIIDADEAYRIGLATTRAKAGDELAQAKALGRRLSTGPAFAHAMTKQMLESEHTMSLDAAIEAEAQAQAICMQHPDFRAAHDAWNEKRPIMFKGAPGAFELDK